LPILVAMVLLLGAGTAVWAQALRPAPLAALGCNQPATITPSSTASNPTSSNSTSANSTSSNSTSSNSTSANPTSANPTSTAGSHATTGGTQGGRTTTQKSAQSFQAPSGSDGASAGRSGATSKSTAKTTAKTTAKKTTTKATATSATATVSVVSGIGEFTDPNLLVEIRPASPALIPLRVFNASAVVGQAKTVTDELRAAGFASILPQDNDPLYPAANYPQAALHCYGEIRFGPAGLAEARTVLIVAPCAQLVLDDRIDNSVDLSLGTKYTLVPINSRMKAELSAIKNASVPPAVIEGQTQAPKPLPPIPDLPSTAGCTP
jgi:hypothetical protein